MAHGHSGCQILRRCKSSEALEHIQRPLGELAVPRRYPRGLCSSPTLSIIVFPQLRASRAWNEENPEISVKSGPATGTKLRGISCPHQMHSLDQGEGDF